MISCVAWIPKGAADPNPKRYELGAAELAMLEEEMKMRAELKRGEGDEPTRGKKGAKKVVGGKDVDAGGLPADLRMDEYSSDEDEAAVGNLLVGKSSEMVGTSIGEDGMPVEEIEEEEDEEEEDESDDDESDEDNKDEDDDIEDDEDDDDDNSEESFDEDDLRKHEMEDMREYTPVDIEGLQAMGLGGGMYFGDDSDADSDIDDTNLAPDDALILVAKTEQDFAALEVYVYEENSGNLYVHHDIPLPAFPLCLAHGDINHEGKVGNYCAVGTFNPGIELWNLDVLDALEPVCSLGGESSSSQNKKKDLVPGSHTDAVMSLSWNKVHRQVIASSSADCTVKLWDITQAGNGGEPASTFTHHKDKVQSVAWHPVEGTMLATGSYDRTVCLVDARSKEGDKRVAKIPADCEALAWDPFHEQYLSAASEDGSILCWDVRKFGQPVWSFVAHEFGGVSDLSYNSHVPGMLATCAIDKTVALWDTLNVASLPNSRPQLAMSKDMKVDKLYSISFYPSSPWLVGCGGAGNDLSLWNLMDEAPIQERFAHRVPETAVTQPIITENDTPENNAKEDFEAMMLAGDAQADDIAKKITHKKKDKKKGKKKDKVHRRTRYE